MENRIQLMDPQKDQSKSNKKWIIILVIIISLIIFIFTGIKIFLDLKLQREKTTSSIDQQTERQENIVQESKEYAKNYKSSGISEVYDKCMKSCMPAGSVACKDGCLTDEAIDKKDMSACSVLSNLNDTDGKDSRKAGCQVEVAAATLNLDNCEKITYGSEFVKEYSRYSCYTEIAGKKKDLSICEKIPKNYLLGKMFKNCIDYVNSDW